jgi:hypothetical protein
MIIDKQIMQISPYRGNISPEDIMAVHRNNFIIRVFDPLVIAFFNELSRSILRNSRLNTVGATAALGFWLRKSHIESIIAENHHIVNSKNVEASPAGIVFHVCPSNVDTMFLYSLAISLLAGNKNILRISQRFSDPLIDLVFDLINITLDKEEYKVLQAYISIVTYGHDPDVNNYFSEIADVRILWGGDATIKTFKSFNTGTRTKDIAFADRISASIFKTSAFNTASEEIQKEIARKFFNDSYTFDQMGCSSPQTIYLMGSEEENVEFEKKFYALLEHAAMQNYKNDIASLASLKLNKLVEDSLNNENLKSVEMDSNYLYFIAMDTYNEELLHSCGAGYFYIQSVGELKDMMKLVTKKMQTFSYFGFTSKEIKDLANLSAGLGIDRIVPVGSALDFEYIWDGYNLVDALTSKKWVV